MANAIRDAGMDKWMFLSTYYLGKCILPDSIPSLLSGIYLIALFAVSLGKKATIHQVTAMLATSKNVLFPGHIPLLTTGADDLTLIITWVPGG